MHSSYLNLYNLSGCLGRGNLIRGVLHKTYILTWNFVGRHIHRKIRYISRDFDVKSQQDFNRLYLKVEATFLL